MTKIRVGLLGAGAMGEEHAFCFGQMEGVEVTAVYSRSLERARAVAGPLGAVATDDAAGVCADETLDAVDICLPTPAHTEHVVAALGAGRHVFCETPLAVDPAEARRMRDAARKAGKLLQVGLLMRSIAAGQWVKRAVDSGGHGRLLSITAHRLGSYLRGDAADHKAHYSDPTTELMTFDLDFIGWVMGRPREVVARSASLRGTLGEVEALLVYDDGRTATALASGILPSSFPFTTGFRAQFEDAAFETQTVIDAGAFTNITRLYAADGAHDPQLAGANPYQVELERFLRCIRGEADPALLDVDRAIEALDLSLTVQRSLADGQPARVSNQP